MGFALEDIFCLVEDKSTHLKRKPMLTSKAERIQSGNTKIQENMNDTVFVVIIIIIIIIRCIMLGNTS